jgi:hypothetical protein
VGNGFPVGGRGAKGQSKVHEAELGQLDGTAFAAAAKYRLKVLAPVGVPNVVALKLPEAIGIPH